MSFSDVSVTPIRAVLFDYGLVLTGPPDPAAWERMKAVLAADETGFHEAYWKHRHDYDRGALGGLTYWQSVARELHKELRQEQAADFIAADTALWTQPNQVMIDWAAALQRAGVKIGILSNLGDAIEEGVLAQCRWLREFTHLTFSHRLGVTKPDSAIYLHAGVGLDVPVREILFVDDREENVAGAVAVGMQAVRYIGHEAFEQEMRARGLGYLLAL